MKYYIGAMLVAACSAAKDTHKTFEQVCYEHGFAAESFSVVTEDGYVS